MYYLSVALCLQVMVRTLVINSDRYRPIRITEYHSWAFLPTGTYFSPAASIDNTVETRWDLKARGASKEALHVVNGDNPAG